MKSISRKFHHLTKIQSNRKPRYFKVFRKAKIRPIPDLETLNSRALLLGRESFNSAMFQPIEILEPLNFIKEEFLEAIKLNPEPLRHFTTIRHDTGACVVVFDNLDWGFSFGEAIELWNTYLSEDEAQKFSHKLKDFDEQLWNLNTRPMQGTLSYPIPPALIRMYGLEKAHAIHQQWLYRRK